MAIYTVCQLSIYSIYSHFILATSSSFQIYHATFGFSSIYKNKIVLTFSYFLHYINMSFGNHFVANIFANFV